LTAQYNKSKIVKLQYENILMILVEIIYLNHTRSLEFFQVHDKKHMEVMNVER